VSAVVRVTIVPLTGTVSQAVLNGSGFHWKFFFKEQYPCLECVSAVAWVTRVRLTQHADSQAVLDGEGRLCFDNANPYWNLSSALHPTLIYHLTTRSITGNQYFALWAYCGCRKHLSKRHLFQGPHRQSSSQTLTPTLDNNHL